MGSCRHAGNRIRRSRLVAARVLILGLWLFASGQAISRAGGHDHGGDYLFRFRAAGGESRTLRLLGVETLRAYRCSRLHSHPAVYLLLAPGPAVLAGVLLARRTRGAGLLLLVLGLLAVSAEPFPADRIQRGVDAFAAGEYRQALAAFGSAEEALGCNAGLRYDMALCHYVQGETGQAVFYLWESILGAPHAMLPRSLLQAVEEEAGLIAQWEPPAAVHPNLPFILTLLFFNLFCTVLALLLGFPSLRSRKGWLFIGSVFLALAMLGSLAFFARTVAVNRRPLAVVVAAQADFKRVPLGEAEPWIILPEGSSLRVDGRAEGHVLVRTAQALIGWVEEGAVRVARESR